MTDFDAIPPMEPDDRDGLFQTRQAVRDAENEISDLALTLEFHSMMESMRTMPAWVQIRDRIQTIVTSETEKLLSGRMDAYALGRRQGRIAALRTLLQLEPPSQQEVDDLTARMQNAVRSLEYNRNLLR